MRWTAFACVVVLCLFAGGCVNRVVAPVEVIAPATVYVADHGKHSSLLLPDGPAVPGDGYVQYAFGDWRCFVLNENSLLDYLRAAVLSNESALGRELHPTTRPTQLRRRVRATLTPLTVESADVSLLRRQLEAHWHRRSDEAVDNRTVRMVLVPYGDGPHQRYSFLNHCNHATSRWLRRLGVQSPRAATFSRFVVTTDSCDP